ncbi:MAG: PAS domain S-box protein [Coleofasciculus sp. B1-GNL1-01]|uniref:PAS domain S-box protein n=1 Tax=Coleofasciculus sp. B1-GNL1-01 TaxID=3068484 RepID=UPI003302897C
MNTLVLSNTTVNLEQLYPDRHIDSAAKATFDDLTRLAASVVQTPIALISLCDAKGQWLPSQVGLDTDSTPQYLEFCRQIRQDIITENKPLLVVEDTLALSESQITSLPIRFYAAVPLVTPQQETVGILLVIDRVPRQLTGQQKDALTALSRQAIAQLEWQKKVIDLESQVHQCQRLEKALQTSPQNLVDMKVALDQASIVAITDCHGKIRYVNDKFCQISHYSREELYGADHHLLNSGYHPPQFFQDLWNTISQGKIWRGDIQDRAKGGNLYWVDTTIVPLVDDQGNPYEYISICKDITEQKQAKIELDRFFRLSPDLMAVIGFDGKFKRINPAFQKTLAYNPEEFLSEAFLDFVHPYDHKATLTAWQTLLESSSDIYFEHRYRCRDGSYKWLAWNCLPLAEAGVVHAIARDITNTKQRKASLLERSRLSTLEADIGAVLVGQNGSLGESLKRCTEAMIRHLNALGAGIWTVAGITDETQMPLVLEMQANSGEQLPTHLFPQRILTNQGLIAKVAQTLKPIHRPILTAGHDLSNKTFIGIYPLIVESRLVGFIALHNRQPFSKIVQGVLGWVANAIAVAIDRIWVREELLSRREALLFQLASQIRNSLELDTILDTAVTEIRGLLEVDGCHFLWLKSNADQPSLSVTHEARDPNLPSLLGDCLPPQLTPLADIINRLHPLRIDDVSQTQNLAPETRTLLADWGITSGLVLPLQTKTGQLGAIICSYYQGSRQWSDREVKLLQAVVDQLAIAIEHAELFAETRAAAQAAQTQANQLEKALHELRQTQSLLIQTEKMSTIGQMVAGIAHEINNPVNFITGNLSHTTNYIGDLLQLIECYQQSYPNPQADIQEFIEDIELSFLIEDLPKMLSSMKMGADRIQEIVISLRNFSRLDQAEMKPVNIHEGIDSTLLILRNRMKPCGNSPGITLIKEYGDLPVVACYAGQLNQVFMNIISNAIDAFDALIKAEENATEKSQTTLNPTIWISTEVVDKNQAVIRIRDNGPGMSETVRDRLFDPFFTTKPVGKGTGLGLSISHQIVVEKHGGILKCYSEPGQGTEFWIQIPITD